MKNFTTSIILFVLNACVSVVLFSCSEKPRPAFSETFEGNGRSIKKIEVSKRIDDVEAFVDSTKPVEEWIGIFARARPVDAPAKKNFIEFRIKIYLEGGSVLNAAMMSDGTLWSEGESYQVEGETGE